MVDCATLKVNSSFSINISCLILPYQLDTMPDIDIPQTISNYKLKTVNLPLFSILFLSTFLSVCF